MPRPTALGVRHGLMAELRAKGALAGEGRKTRREQAARIPPHEMPDWCITLPLPDHMTFALSPGPTAVAGVSVRQGPLGLQLEAAGKNYPWLFDQLARALGRINNGWQGRMHLRAQRDAYPGCTDGAPLRAAIDRATDAYLVMTPSLVIPRGHRAPLILKV